MKTLIIHPDDPTTECLKLIYEGRGWRVINQKIKKDELKSIIEQYQRIIMLGHGTPFGLVHHKRHITNHTFSDLFRTRKCIFIWCHADEFVKSNNLSGLYSGMFISEMQEADLYNIQTTEQDITYSNNLFSQALRDVIDSDDMLNDLKQKYKSDSDPIIQFNNERLYYK